jgi:hypothetical protein
MLVPLPDRTVCPPHHKSRLFLLPMADTHSLPAHSRWRWLWRGLGCLGGLGLLAFGGFLYQFLPAPLAEIEVSEYLETRLEVEKHSIDSFLEDAQNRYEYQVYYVRSRGWFSEPEKTPLCAGQYYGDQVSFRRVNKSTIELVYHTQLSSYDHPEAPMPVTQVIMRFHLAHYPDVTSECNVPIQWPAYRLPDKTE